MVLLHVPFPCYFEFDRHPLHRFEANLILHQFGYFVYRVVSKNINHIYLSIYTYLLRIYYYIYML